MNKATELLLLKLFVHEGCVNQTIQELLDLGADLQVRFSDGSNLVQVAAKQKNYDLGKKLLRLGVVLSDADKHQVFYAVFDGCDCIYPSDLFGYKELGSVPTYFTEEGERTFNFLYTVDKSMALDMYLYHICREDRCRIDRSHCLRYNIPRKILFG